MMFQLTMFVMLTHSLELNQPEPHTAKPSVGSRVTAAPAIWRKLLATNESHVDPKTFYHRLRSYLSPQGIELRYWQGWTSRVYSVRDSDYRRAAILMQNAQAPRLAEPRPWSTPSNKKTNGLFRSYNIASVRWPLGKKQNNRLGDVGNSQVQDLVAYLKDLNLQVRVERATNVDGGFATLNIWIPRNQLPKAHSALLSSYKMRPNRWSKLWIHFVADEARYRGERLFK